ncbi:hypothetical protein JB92DRAFT_3119185 [Gautieria morchelliformis]|nr:hypothetical protein JB92DRAFT_3119185 [Gautieria morchelliformis]
MSGNSGARDYYYSSSRGSQRDGRGTDLPSIRDTLGDVLSQPVWPDADGRTRSQGSIGINRGGRTDHNVSSRAQPNPGSHAHHRGVSMPNQPHSRNVPAHEAQPRQQQSNYTYAVYRATPSGELIEQNEPASRGSREGVPRRYICDECGKRYDRPSTLEAHKRSHEGIRPYSCGYCDKTFVTKSNMRRHERSHGATSAFEPVAEDQDEESATSSSYFPPQTAGRSSNTPHVTSSQQPSQYYSSSRRN